MSRIMSYNSNQIISYHLYYVMLYEYPVEIVEVLRFLIKIYNQVAICTKKMSSLPQDMISFWAMLDNSYLEVTYGLLKGIGLWKLQRVDQ